MKISAVLPAVVLAGLVSATGGAVAATDGWFGGIQVAPWIDRSDALLNLDRLDAPVRKRGGGTAVRRFDLEVGYGEGAGPAVAGVASNGTRDFRLAGVGTWSLGDALGLTGRVGAYRGDIEVGSLYRLTPDASLHPTYGMGLRFDVSANLRLQGGWDRYHLGPSLRPGDGVDLLTIGLKYRF